VLEGHRLALGEQTGNGLTPLLSGTDLSSAVLHETPANVALIIRPVADRPNVPFRSIHAGPLMQTPVFLILFLAPVYVPLGLLQGLLHAVASVNPATAFLEAGRGPPSE